MQPTHAEVIERFYEAFKQRDAVAMNACYHPDVEFTDPAFGTLKGDDARAMWTMLCARAKDLAVQYSDVTADSHRGTAHWEARYTFAATGRKVHNVIDARFEFEDGLIRRHIDTFDFARWAGQALGVLGKLLGRASFFQKGFQRKARALLASSGKSA
ncbi:MAG TPA: nuclear transport factor 2 family protein [Actinomycetota bacterium]|nr:nuclear transport factor 2 family protein [Actinomycetota bacterium]